jgi:hypothetical protein
MCAEGGYFEWNSEGGVGDAVVACSDRLSTSGAREWSRVAKVLRLRDSGGDQLRRASLMRAARPESPRR